MAPGLVVLSLLLMMSLKAAPEEELVGDGMAATALWARSVLPSLVGYLAQRRLAEPAIATGMLVELGFRSLGARALGLVWSG